MDWTTLAYASLLTAGSAVALVLIAGTFLVARALRLRRLAAQIEGVLGLPAAWMARLGWDPVVAVPVGVTVADALWQASKVDPTVLDVLGGLDNGLLDRLNEVQAIGGAAWANLVTESTVLVAAEAGAGAAAHTAQTLQTVEWLDNAGQITAKVPWITLAISTIRHGHRTWKGDMTVREAAGHTLLDTASVGGGAFAGAQAGAALGALAGPVGVGVGALLGVVTGATLGRLGAERYKVRMLRDLQSEYTDGLSALPERYVLALREEGLKARAAVAVPERTVWDWLWPSRARMLREAVAQRSLDWAESCEREAEWLQGRLRWQAAEDVGAELLGRPGTFAEADRAELISLREAMGREQRKLGRAA